jgi:hydroxymethylpyrimidine/phosphomethylpyrimidine kinase
VDPVIRSSSGEELLSPDGVRRLTADLLPMTRLLTPNLDEAAALSGLRVRTPEEMAEAARALHDQGAANVLVKGGHLDGGRVIDVLFDGSNMVRLVGDRIAGPSPHGTGCVLSSAIAAYLALGHDLASAVSSGNAVVRRAIRNRLIVGQGWPVCDPIGLGDLARPAPHAP